MKKILAIIAIWVLALNISWAQSPTPPSPPAPPAPSTQDLTAQLQQLQQQVKQLQEQLKQMQNSIMDSVKKKVVIINNGDMSGPGNLDLMDDSAGRHSVIIINGQRVDGFDNNALDSSIRKLDTYHLDSTNVKVYRNNDSVVVNVGKMKIKVGDSPRNNSVLIEKEDRKIKSDSSNNKKIFKVTIGGLRLGLDNYLYSGQFKNAPGYGSLALITGKSIDVGIGIVDGQLNIVKHYITLNTMLGLDIRNYRFSSDNMLVAKSDSVKFNTPTGDQNVTKNKLVTTYAVLPVRLQFATSDNPAKAFRIGVGGRLGYLIGSHTKFIINGDKEKDHDSFNLDDFEYGLEFIIGYAWFNFYVDYDLTPFFSNGVNPQLTPVEVGLVLANF